MKKKQSAKELNVDFEIYHGHILEQSNIVGVCYFISGFLIAISTGYFTKTLLVFSTFLNRNCHNNWYMPSLYTFQPQVEKASKVHEVHFVDNQPL